MVASARWKINLIEREKPLLYRSLSNSLTLSGEYRHAEEWVPAYAGT
jgi:hypothetical protein